MSFDDSILIYPYGFNFSVSSYRAVTGRLLCYNFCLSVRGSTSDSEETHKHVNTKLTFGLLISIALALTSSIVLNG